MTATMTKLLVALCVALPLAAVGVLAQENYNNYLDVEPPNFFQYNSPLRQPDSLRSRPYFDFLSTLYRRDATKSDLFRPYVRQRRAAVAQPDAAPAVAAVAEQGPLQVPLDLVRSVAETPAGALSEERPKRAILFRPLFVYKQQMVRREELRKRRKRV